MKRSIFVANRAATQLKLSRAKLSKVLGCLWHHISIELHLNSTCWEATNGDIEKDNWIFRMSQSILSCQ